MVVLRLLNFERLVNVYFGTVQDETEKNNQSKSYRAKLTFSLVKLDKIKFNNSVFKKSELCSPASCPYSWNFGVRSTFQPLNLQY